MATVFSRLQFLQRTYNKSKFPTLSQEQKVELGNIICQRYLNQVYIRDTIQKIDSKEPEGVFKVLSYPKKFAPEIDYLILEYYRNLPKKTSKRKRIQVGTPAPVFSTRITPNKV